MKIFISRIISEKAIQLLNNAGIETIVWKEKREVASAELVEFCKDVDGLISVGQNIIDKTFLNQCSHLKVIAQMAVGYDNIDVQEANRLGIPIGNTPGVLSKATADTAFLLMLAVARKAFYMNQQIIAGNWGFYEPMANLGIEISGKTLGIFGLGKIGLEMAKRCNGAYQMPILYCNRNANPIAEEMLGARKVTFDELLSHSDVVSVHCALTPDTKGIFNRDAFSKMKHSAIFINTSRGAVHHEEDLLAALQNQTIWGAGLDVTNPEPMRPDNALLFMPNVAVLPHIGSATEETREAMAGLAAANIIAGLKGQNLPTRVHN